VIGKCRGYHGRGNILFTDKSILDLTFDIDNDGRVVMAVDIRTPANLLQHFKNESASQ